MAGLVGGGVGGGRAGSALLSSLDALARTASALADTKVADSVAAASDGVSSTPPFLKLRPDPDEDVVFSGTAGFSASFPSASDNPPSAATPPQRSSSSLSPPSNHDGVTATSPLSSLSPVKALAAASALTSSTSLKNKPNRLGSVKRLEVGRPAGLYAPTKPRVTQIRFKCYQRIT